MQITTEQLDEITRQPLVGILATVSRGGAAQATPIWYLYDGETFNVTGHTARVKVRNIRYNPNVSLVVVDTLNNGQPLIVNGSAELIEEGADEYTEKMCIRYQGEAKGKESAQGLVDYALSIGQRRVIICITPNRIIYGK